MVAFTELNPQQQAQVERFLARSKENGITVQLSENKTSLVLMSRDAKRIVATVPISHFLDTPTSP